MKKTVLFAALATLSLVLTGCGTNAKTDEPVQSSTAKSTTTATLTADEVTTTASDAATTVSTSETTTQTDAVDTPSSETAANNAPAQTETATWKTAYKQALTDFMNSENYSDQSSWDIRDLDNDGTPELLISEAQYHAAGVAIYYYENGNVLPAHYDNGEEARYGSYGEMFCCPEEHLIGSYNIHMGYNYSIMHKYENHIITTVQITCEDSGAVGAENVTYTVNDATVSKEEFDNAVSTYSSKNWTNAGVSYKFNDFSPLD
jgi:hypothetical protein